MKTCPLCECEQSEGLLCHADTTKIERELGDVAALVHELDISLSKQAKIGNAGPGGLARERTPINVGTMDPIWVLCNVLGTWARDVSGETWQPRYGDRLAFRSRNSIYAGPFCPDCRHSSCRQMRTVIVRPAPAVAVQCSHYLLNEIPAIRRHPAVVELVDEITDAIHLARRSVDRPADRIYLGQCLMETPDEDGRPVTCLEEIWARPWASETTCKVCGFEHPVAERRAWLLKKAEDYLFTVKDASEMLGAVGRIQVTQASIRGYIHRGKIGYRSGNMIRLGDLLAVVVDDSEKKGAA